MSFLQPWMLIALPLVALPIIIHLDQPTPIPNDAVGGDDVLAGRQSHEPRLCENSPVGDLGTADAGDRRTGVRGGSAAQLRIARQRDVRAPDPQIRSCCWIGRRRCRSALPRHR